MKMYVKFDFNALCRKVLDEKLKEYGVKYRMLDFGEVEFYEDFTQEQHSIFKEKLQDYGIEVIESQK
jgi:hypothetical protein